MTVQIEGVLIEIWEWLATYSSFLGFIVLGVFVALFVFQFVRERQEERFSPHLGENRRSILKALNHYLSGESMTPIDAQMAVGAMIASAILSGFTLLAFAHLLANIATPIG